MKRGKINGKEKFSHQGPRKKTRRSVRIKHRAKSCSSIKCWPSLRRGRKWEFMIKTLKPLQLLDTDPKKDWYSFRYTAGIRQSSRVS